MESTYEVETPGPVAPAVPPEPAQPVGLIFLEPADADKPGGNGGVCDVDGECN